MANRDEFYDRTASSMHWWKEMNILAGRDLTAGGTWLAINKKAEFSLVTNYRDADKSKSHVKSRGELPILALSKNEIYTSLSNSQLDYNHYNLLKYSDGKLWYASNVNSFRFEELQPGVHGLSNAFIDTPWPKVEKGKNWLKEELKADRFTVERALEYLSNNEIASDPELPLTGVPLDWERNLSALNISYKNYGTRVSTVMCVDSEGRVKVVELNRVTQEMMEFSFEI